MEINTADKASIHIFFQIYKEITKSWTLNLPLKE